MSNKNLKFQIKNKVALYRNNKIVKIFISQMDCAKYYDLTDEKLSKFLNGNTTKEFLGKNEILKKVSETRAIKYETSLFKRHLSYLKKNDFLHFYCNSCLNLKKEVLPLKTFQTVGVCESCNKINEVSSGSLNKWLIKRNYTLQISDRSRFLRDLMPFELVSTSLASPVIKKNKKEIGIIEGSLVSNVSKASEKVLINPADTLKVDSQSATNAENQDLSPNAPVVDFDKNTTILLEQLNDERIIYEAQILKINNQSGTKTGDQDLSPYAKTADVDSNLDSKVDKVNGERLINATEITKLANQSGTNTGDQDLSSYAKTADVNSNLDSKVDKVTGERLINAAEITKLQNQSGTNTGDQDLSSYAKTADVDSNLDSKVDEYNDWKKQQEKSYNTFNKKIKYNNFKYKISQFLRVIRILISIVIIIGIFYFVGLEFITGMKQVFVESNKIYKVKAIILDKNILDNSIIYKNTEGNIFKIPNALEFWDCGEKGDSITVEFKNYNKPIFIKVKSIFNKEM